MTTGQEGLPMALANERVAWFNDKIVGESEVLIPFRDQGFLRGDAVFDMTRSFNGKAFRLAVAARQDAPVSEPGAGRPGGEGAETGRLGGIARRQWQSRGGSGEQHLSGTRRPPADPEGALCAARRQPSGGDRPRSQP